MRNVSRSLFSCWKVISIEANDDIKNLNSIRYCPADWPVLCPKKIFKKLCENIFYVHVYYQVLCIFVSLMYSIRSCSCDLFSISPFQENDTILYSEFYFKFLVLPLIRSFYSHKNVIACLRLQVSKANTKNESSNEGYLFCQEEETYKIVAGNGYFGRLIFQYASFNDSRSLHFFLAAWHIVGIWFTTFRY